MEVFLVNRGWGRADLPKDSIYKTGTQFENSNRVEKNMSIRFFDNNRKRQEKRGSLSNFHITD